MLLDIIAGHILEIALAVVVLYICILLCVIAVRQNTVVVLENMFSGTRTVVQPGIHFRSPFQIVHKRKWGFLEDSAAFVSSSSGSGIRPGPRSKDYIKTNIRKYDPVVLKARTKDQVEVGIDLLCFYKISDVLKSVNKVDNLKAAIAGVINTEVYRRVAEEDHQKLSHAGVIGRAELKIINKEAAHYGVTVNSVRVEGIIMPENISEAIQNAVANRQVAMTKLLSAESENDTKIQMAHVEMNLMKLQHERALLEAEHANQVHAMQLNVEMNMEIERKALFGEDIDAFIKYKQIQAWEQLAKNGGMKTVYAPLEALQMSAFAERFAGGKGSE